MDHNLESIDFEDDPLNGSLLDVSSQEEVSYQVTCGIYGPRREKTCLCGFANTKGADQPAHPRSLISAFVIRFLESSICKLATGKISIF